MSCECYLPTKMISLVRMQIAMRNELEWNEMAALKWYGTDDDFCEYGCTCERFICENYARECVN